MNLQLYQVEQADMALMRAEGRAVDNANGPWIIMGRLEFAVAFTKDRFGICDV